MYQFIVGLLILITLVATGGAVALAGLLASIVGESAIAAMITTLLGILGLGGWAWWQSKD